jgi:hypothetical protein
LAAVGFEFLKALALAPMPPYGWPATLPPMQAVIDLGFGLGVAGAAVEVA